MYNEPNLLLVHKKKVLLEVGKEISSGVENMSHNQMWKFKLWDMFFTFEWWDMFSTFELCDLFDNRCIHGLLYLQGLTVRILKKKIVGQMFKISFASKES